MNGRVAIAVVLAVGVVVPGVLDFALARAGRPGLGAAVWAVGYLSAVLVAWYVWLRPLDWENA